MAFVNTIEKYGDEATMDMIIERTIDEYCDNSAEKIGQYAFFVCTALAKVDVPKVTSIEANSMYGCSALVALILRNEEAVCTLANANALTSTPIASGTGYIYVPAALYDSYASGTNWSTYSAQLRKLEEYTVDGTTTGDLDETKI